MSDTNSDEQNNASDDGKNNKFFPPVTRTSTATSATMNNVNTYKQDHESSDESEDDIDRDAEDRNMSRCSIRTHSKGDMVSGEEEALQLPVGQRCHLKRKRDREHLNHAINELRSSLDQALSAPLLPEPVGSVASEELRSVEVAVQDVSSNRIDEDKDKQENPFSDHANCVELVNQASSLISEMSRDNMRLRQEIGELIAGRHKSLSWGQRSGHESASS